MWSTSSLTKADWLFVPRGVLALFIATGGARIETLKEAGSIICWRGGYFSLLRSGNARHRVGRHGTESCRFWKSRHLLETTSAATMRQEL